MRRYFSSGRGSYQAEAPAGTKIHDIQESPPAKVVIMINHQDGDHDADGYEDGVPDDDEHQHHKTK